MALVWRRGRLALALALVPALVPALMQALALVLLGSGW